MAGIKMVGNKNDVFRVVIKNNDTQVIFANAPVVLDFSGTTDLGKAVKTTNSLAAAEQGNFFGINISGNLGVGVDGEAQVFGYNPNARVVLTTRSATNATWASIAAGAIGEYLTLGTGTGSAAGAGDQALVRVATAAMSVAQFIKLCESFASTDTQASSLGPQSVTVWTTTRKVFLARM